MRRFRFAPSPNGFLHLGHALSALTNAAMAERADGHLLLRLEDIDVGRSREIFAEAIGEDLRWMGLRWEEPVRRQSEHFGAYQDLLDRLQKAELVYPAFMSRGELRARLDEAEAGGYRWPRDPDGTPLYPGLDKKMPPAERRRRIAAGNAHVWRLDMDEAMRRVPEPLFWGEWADEAMTTRVVMAADPSAWGDVILARRDVPTSYHLCVTADDEWQGITDVVRGRDILPATAVHRLLQKLLGFREPTYYHHRLIVGADGRKLSKSEGALALRALRERGVGPNEIRLLLAQTEAANQPA